MATSGSIDYSLTRDTIIDEACQICKINGEGVGANTNQLSDWARTLNILVKSLNARPGLNLWAIEKLVMFPVKGQYEYSFGSSGDRMCKTSELIETELDGAHASGATTLTVAGKDGTTNMADSDVIGIETDSTGIHWTTISGTPTSTSIAIASGLAGAAAGNSNVYTYTTAFSQDLLNVQNMWRRTDSGTDIPIEIISRQEYIDLSDKDSSGPVTQAYYDPQLGTGTLSVWQTPSDLETEELIYIRGSRRFEDFDAAANTPDFPQEWYLALVYNLALLRAPACGITGQEFREIDRLATQFLQEAIEFDQEPGSIYLMPDDQEGTYRR